MWKRSEVQRNNDQPKSIDCESTNTQHGAMEQWSTGERGKNDVFVMLSNELNE